MCTYELYPTLREPVEDLEKHERREEHDDVEVDLVAEDREREARLRDRVPDILVQQLRNKFDIF